MFSTDLPRISGKQRLHNTATVHLFQMEPANTLVELCTPTRMTQVRSHTPFAAHCSRRTLQLFTMSEGEAPLIAAVDQGTTSTRVLVSLSLAINFENYVRY